MSTPTRIPYYRDLLVELTKKELKVRYKSSTLGYLWSIASPLVQALVFIFAIDIIMKIKVENYPVFLITGLFPWQWFSNSLNSSVIILLANASIIKKTVFPKEFLVVAGVMNDMIHFVLAIPVVLVLIAIYGGTLHPFVILGLPALILIQIALTSGISLFLSSVNLFFRDLERLTGIVVNIVLYLTPVLYPADRVPAEYRFALYVNPVAPLVMSYRELLLDGRLRPELVALAAGYALLIFLVGAFVFRKLSPKFAEVL